MHSDAWPTDVTTPPEKSKNSKQRRYKNFVFILLYFLYLMYKNILIKSHLLFLLQNDIAFFDYSRRAS